MKNLRTLAAISAAAIVALAGCSGSGEPGATPGTGDPSPPDTTDTPAATETVQIDFWHGYTEADGQVLDRLVQEFNDSQDAITITPTTKPWATLLDTLLPALTAGNGPQLVALPPEHIPVYATRGALQSLESWYEAPDSGAAVLNEGAVTSGLAAGERFGAPLSFTPLTMFYNRTMFEAAGVEVPTTWDEWVTTAAALTVDENGDGTPDQYGLALQDNITVGNGVWLSLLKSGGGDVVTEAGEVVVDSPENADTLAFWAAAVRDHQISPTGLTGADADGLFSAGRVAMTFGGPWLATVSEASGIDYGIAPLPAGPVGIQASALAVDLSVTSQATEAEKAAIETFLTWFYQRDNMITWSLASGWPPLTTEVTADDVAENPVVAALTEQSGYGVALLPGIVPQTDILTELDTVTQKALTGSDPAELLATAQSAMEAALAD